MSLQSCSLQYFSAKESQEENKYDNDDDNSSSSSQYSEALLTPPREEEENEEEKERQDDEEHNNDDDNLQYEKEKTTCSNENNGNTLDGKKSHTTAMNSKNTNSNSSNNENDNENTNDINTRETSNDNDNSNSNGNYKKDDDDNDDDDDDISYDSESDSDSDEESVAHDIMNNNNNNNNDHNKKVINIKDKLHEMWNTLDVEFRNVGKSLACPICCETLKNPVLLPCIHAYCKGCINMMIKQNNNKNLECPACRLKISKRSIIELPPEDNNITNLVYSYKQMIRAFGLTPIIHDPNFLGMTQLPDESTTQHTDDDDDNDDIDNDDDDYDYDYVKPSSTKKKKKKQQQLDLLETHQHLEVTRTWNQLLQDKANNTNGFKSREEEIIIKNQLKDQQQIIETDEKALLKASLQKAKKKAAIIIKAKNKAAVEEEVDTAEAAAVTENENSAKLDEDNTKNKNKDKNKMGTTTTTVTTLEKDVVLGVKSTEVGTKIDNENNNSTVNNSNNNNNNNNKNNSNIHTLKGKQKKIKDIIHKDNSRVESSLINKTVTFATTSPIPMSNQPLTTCKENNVVVKNNQNNNDNEISSTDSSSSQEEQQQIFQPPNFGSQLSAITLDMESQQQLIDVSMDNIRDQEAVNRSDEWVVMEEEQEQRQQQLKQQIELQEKEKKKEKNKKEQDQTERERIEQQQHQQQPHQCEESSIPNTECRGNKNEVHVEEKENLEQLEDKVEEESEKRRRREIEIETEMLRNKQPKEVEEEEEEKGRKEVNLAEQKEELFVEEEEGGKVEATTDEENIVERINLANVGVAKSSPSSKRLNITAATTASSSIDDDNEECQDYEKEDDGNDSVDKEMEKKTEKIRTGRSLKLPSSPISSLPGEQIVEEEYDIPIQNVSKGTTHDNEVPAEDILKQKVGGDDTNNNIKRVEIHAQNNTDNRNIEESALRTTPINAKKVSSLTVVEALGEPVIRQEGSNHTKEKDTNVVSSLIAPSGFDVGTIVDVQSRTWPGINKPGGVARITKINDNGHSYDVTYVLGGKEKNVGAVYIKLHNDEEQEGDNYSNDTTRQNANNSNTPTISSRRGNKRRSSRGQSASPDKNDKTVATAASTLKSSSSNNGIGKERRKKSRRIAKNDEHNNNEIPPDLLAKLAADGFDTCARITTKGKQKLVTIKKETTTNRQPKKKKVPPKDVTNTASSSSDKKSVNKKRRKQTEQEQQKELPNKTSSEPNTTKKQKTIHKSNNKKSTAIQQRCDHLPSLTDEEKCTLADKRYYDLLRTAMEDSSVINIVPSSLSEQDMDMLELLCKETRKSEVRIKLNKDFHPTKTTICVMTIEQYQKQKDFTNSGNTAAAGRVAAVRDNDSIPSVARVRTLKAMRVQLAGLPIVSPAFVASCLEAKKFVLPSSNMFIRTLPTKVGLPVPRDGHPSNHLGVANYAARMHQCKKGLITASSRLLDNTAVFLCGPYSGPVPKRTDIQVLLRESNATILTSPSMAVKTLKAVSAGDKAATVVLLCDGSETNEQNSMTSSLIKEAKAVAANATNKKSGHGCVKVANFNWLFDSISCGRQLTAEGYEPANPVAKELWRHTLH